MERGAPSGERRVSLPFASYFGSPYRETSESTERPPDAEGVLYSLANKLFDPRPLVFRLFHARLGPPVVPFYRFLFLFSFFLGGVPTKIDKVWALFCNPLDRNGESGSESQTVKGQRAIFFHARGMVYIPAPLPIELGVGGVRPQVSICASTLP